MDLKSHLLAQLVRLLDEREVARITGPSALRREVRLVVERLLDEANPLLNRWEQEMTIDQVVADALGFGPLEGLFADDRVQEVEVHGPDSVRVRLVDRSAPANIPFRNLEQLYLIAARLLGAPGRPVEPAPNSAVEREVAPDFWMTASFPATRAEPPALHFRRVRPCGPPAPVPAPRLAPREQAAFVRFVQACYRAGLEDLPGAEEARLRGLAEKAADEFAPEERECIVALLLREARQPWPGPSLH